MPDTGLIVILDERTRVDWSAAVAEHAAVVLVPESRMTPKLRRSVDAARGAFGRERVLDTYQAFTPQVLSDAVHWLREQGAERIELRADPRHWDIARIGISLSREPGIALTDLDGIRADERTEPYRLENEDRTGVIVILDTDSPRFDWDIVAFHRRACVVLAEDSGNPRIQAELAAATATFEETGTLGNITGFAWDESMARSAIDWLRGAGMERVEIWAGAHHHAKIQSTLSALDEAATICTHDGRPFEEDDERGQEIGVLAFFGNELLDGPDWDVIADQRGACVIIPQRAEDALNGWSIADAVSIFKDWGTPLRVADGSIDAENLRRAIAWLRKKGTPYIEVWADRGLHPEIRALIEHLGEDARFCDIDGVTEEPERALMQQRSKTTSTLLVIAADAVFTEATVELGSFERLIVDEIGWDIGRPITGARALAGWERRVAMLCGAVRPGMTAVIASPHPAMRRAAIRMLSAIPHVGMKDAVQLGEWDSDNVVNFTARLVENAKERGGRGPERIVIVVREDAEFVEDALYRSTTALDESRVEIITVDPQLGLLERHVTAFWSEKDAAAHAANLRAILAERESSEPF